jgi:hypothetical protein
LIGSAGEVRFTNNENNGSGGVTGTLAAQSQPRLAELIENAQKELFPWEKARASGAGGGRTGTLAMGAVLALLIGAANADQLGKLRLNLFGEIGLHERLEAAVSSTNIALRVPGKPLNDNAPAPADERSSAQPAEREEAKDAPQNGGYVAAADLGPRVQLGSYLNGRTARTGWEVLSARHRGPLMEREHRLVAGTVHGRKVVRVQVLTASHAEASDLCISIRNAGGDCFLPI